MTINSQKEARNQAGDDLNHEPKPAPGQQMIHFEMAFPPGKKDFDIPPELINRGDLLGGETKLEDSKLPYGHLRTNQSDKILKKVRVMLIGLLAPRGDNDCIHGKRIPE